MQVIKDFNGKEHEIGENDVKTIYQAKPDDVDNPEQESASGDPPGTKVPMNKLNPFAMAKLGKAVPIKTEYSAEEIATVASIGLSFGFEFVGAGEVILGWLGIGSKIAKFSPIENAVIKEAKKILSNEKIIQKAFESGIGTELQIAGRTIIVEPGAPLSGMTLFEEKAFVIGREAFASRSELIKTILHELYRLQTSGIPTSGATQAAVTQETAAAASFAERAFSLFK
ncbi:hypothetical protein GCM10028774_65360 [Spirosoma jeollabukense]